MKPRHATAYRDVARATLALINAHVGQDFHTLRTSQIDELLKLADQQKYKRPNKANGSRARYFYALLQRRASQ